MIPKIIHYCWFGQKEKPDSFYRYLKTWKEHLPGFEFKEWSEANFDVNHWLYSREAYATGNYAHVSDVCRIYALSVYGGVYLDTDVEVLESFDKFLSDKSFMGMEADCVGTCVIGAQANVQWLNMFLKYYENTHFINFWGHCRKTTNTIIFTHEILPKVSEDECPTIYPVGYFCDYEKPMSIKPCTVTIHHYHATWRRKKSLCEKIRAIWRGFQIRHFWNRWADTDRY